MDLLDLSGLTSLTQLQVKTGMTIYYAAAALSFTPPADTNGIAQEPEEYLDGMKMSGGGHLRWVKNFAGANSSVATVVINPVTGLPQSIQVNAALRNSQILDSNGDGIANGNQGFAPPPASGPQFSSPFTAVLATVAVNGNGTVTPNLNGQLLISNQVYSVTAKPADGATFGGWSGSIETNTPLLTFVATDGLSFTANFTYQAGTGTYVGLFYQPGDIEVGESGSITITKSANGKFSGDLQFAGSRNSFSGTLDGNGAANIGVPNTSLALAVQAGTAQITGTVFNTDPPIRPKPKTAKPLIAPGNWSSPFQANLNVFNSKTNPAPFAGSYTIIFPGSGDPSNTGQPLGDGYGSVTVDTAGNVKLSGVLADGTTITESATVSKDGQWPLFISSLYSGNGQVLSWLTFGRGGAPDLGGSFNWIKPATSAKQYPAGFNATENAVGSPYNSAVAPITGFGTGLMQFFGGDLSSTITDLVSLGTNNKVVNLGPAKVSMTLTPKQGFFSGSVTDPLTGKAVKFNGAVLQKQATGSGYFLGTDQSGLVTLNPNL